MLNMGVEASSPILRLPDEIIVRLLHLCSYQTILSFARTCRRCQDLVVDTLYWPVFQGACHCGWK
ncbi:hypothetical protein B0J17DRAFT_666397 [Rhizoctonia solani]|nr:hypothetical protein B0J17DRAFT_666397 [Rhizoctonia solani]